MNIILFYRAVPQTQKLKAIKFEIVVQTQSTNIRKAHQQLSFLNMKLRKKIWEAKKDIQQDLF